MIDLNQYQYSTKKENGKFLDKIQNYSESIGKDDNLDATGMKDLRNSGVSGKVGLRNIPLDQSLIENSPPRMSVHEKNHLSEVRISSPHAQFYKDFFPKMGGKRVMRVKTATRKVSSNVCPKSN